jgi:hypothetical protein
MRSKSVKAERIDGAAHQNTCVVDPNVEMPETVDRLRHGALQGFRMCAVGLDRERLATAGFDIGNQGCGRQYRASRR